MALSPAGTGQVVPFSRVGQRAAGADLVSGDAPHGGVGPADETLGSDGDNRLLHGIEHGGQFLAAGLEFGGVLAEALRGLVESRFHGRELLVAGLGKASGQIAVRDAAGKGGHPSEAGT